MTSNRPLEPVRWDQGPSNDERAAASSSCLRAQPCEPPALAYVLGHETIPLTQGSAVDDRQH